MTAALGLLYVDCIECTKCQFLGLQAYGVNYCFILSAVETKATATVENHNTKRKRKKKKPRDKRHVTEYLRLAYITYRSILSKIVAIIKASKNELNEYSTK